MSTFKYKDTDHLSEDAANIIDWIRVEGARQLRGAKYVQNKHDSLLCKDLGIETSRQAQGRIFKEKMGVLGERIRGAFSPKLTQDMVTLVPPRLGLGANAVKAASDAELRRVDESKRRGW